MQDTLDEVILLALTVIGDMPFLKLFLFLPHCLMMCLLGKEKGDKEEVPSN